MATLAVDLESFSSVDLKACGVHAYAAAPDFAVLLLGFAFDDEPVQVVDLAQGEAPPARVIRALFDPAVLKTAFNAAFERTCLARHFDRPLPADQWQCTAVHALTLGLPMSLAQVGEALKLEQDKQKTTAGMTLIRYFCVPCKPTARNGHRTRNLPHHDQAKWILFKEYNGQDVVAERAVRQQLLRHPVPDDEQRLWALDQRINDTGVRIDAELVRQAIARDTTYRTRLEAEAAALTGLANPQSVTQLKGWLSDEEGVEVDSLTKATVPELIAQAGSDTTRRVLEIRQELAKTSVTKYASMDRSVCPDGRIRGLLQFYGANRTGRWAGRLVQVQNLPQNHLKDLDLAREMVRAGDHETLELLFGNVPDVLSQLIRTAFIPSEGHRFIVADFSAIEARVIAWLADEAWRMEVFATHGKIYEASASQMFRVPIGEVTKGSPLRQKGKISELALGFQGGKGALITMGALKMGLTEEELPGLVAAWRQSNPNIVQLWQDVESAALTAVATSTPVSFRHGLSFSVEAGLLFVGLPSGRRLAYVRPRVENDARFNKPALTYEGLDQETKAWGRTNTYGGKLVENCLAGDTQVLSERGWIRIADVLGSDRLWDGVEWVTHNGVINQGVQQTIDLDGVRMTPDHEILTAGGWQVASSCEGHHRYEAALPDRSGRLGFERQEDALDNPMRLRQGDRHASDRLPEGPAEVVRMPVEGPDRSGQYDARLLQASRVCSLAVDERPLPAANTSRLDGLRRSGDTGLPRVGSELRSVLAGYGPNIPPGAVTGSDRRERRLQPGELPLGIGEESEPQSTLQPPDRNAVGPNDDVRGCRALSDREDDTDVQTRSRVSTGAFIRRPGRHEPVYDILNAGPRRRFAVKGESGPFIVHNCVQAIARDCLREALFRLDAAGYRIVMHVHDEVVLDAPEGFGSVEDVARIVGAPIDWAPGLPLRADGFETSYYRKD
jgi:DNA polymerase